MLHEITTPPKWVTLRFTRSGTDHSFTTTATSVVIDGDCLEDPENDRLIARMEMETIFGRHRLVYKPPDRRSQVWYDTLTIEPAGEDQ
jgi:hypothetical protein